MKEEEGGRGGRRGGRRGGQESDSMRNSKKERTGGGEGEKRESGRTPTYVPPALQCSKTNVVHMLYLWIDEISLTV